jgi:nucleoid-associated protein YgaU
MLLNDLNGPMSLQPRSSGLRRISQASRYAASAILVLGLGTFGATISPAQEQQDQSVADAARQERVRKQELQKRAKHVYTEEDLKHSNILTPEDRAQIEAKRNECAQKNNCLPAPSQNPPASLDANSQTSGTSLGEVARQLRKQKEWEALKPKQMEPFHLPFSTPVLASPISPERPAAGLPVPPVLHPKIPSNVFRRDPFSAIPLRPEVRRPKATRSEIRPTVREDVRPEVQEDVPANVPLNVHPNFHKDIRPTLRTRQLTAPVEPRISSRPATPRILIQPKQPSAPAKSAEPDEPISTIRPAQPQPVLRPAQTTTQKTVTVQRGDSLWKLAQQNLGRGHRWPELLAVNPRIADPNQIRAGAQVKVPVVTTASVARRSSKTAATIKVRKGDTLWTLAASNFGRSAAWRCLAAANPRIRNPNLIYENQELSVPIGCSP